MGKPMEVKGYFNTVCFSAHYAPTLSAMMSHSFPPGKGGKGHPHRENCVAVTKSVSHYFYVEKEGRELLHLLILNCYQLKIILGQNDLF